MIVASRLVHYYFFSLSPKVLDFANALVEFFNVSRNGSHVGIITYGTEAEVAMDFNTFKEGNLSPAIVQDLINDLRQKGGHRFMDKALKMANERLFTPEAGMRVHNNDTSKVRSQTVLRVTMSDNALFGRTTRRPSISGVLRRF